MNIEIAFTDFKLAHAPTLTLNENNNILVCWFARHTSQDSQTLYQAQYNGVSWDRPKALALPSQGSCWNPVFYRPGNGQLWLFYKVGMQPYDWQGKMLLSQDNGENWAGPFDLEEGYLGPTKNPPIPLDKDWLLIPSSRESSPKNSLCFERMNLENGSKQQTRVETGSDNPLLRLIQPSLVTKPDGVILALCRSNDNYLYQSQSYDEGKNWSQPKITKWRNPNAAICTLSLTTGYILVYNPSVANRFILRVSFIAWGDDKEQVLAEYFDDKKALAYPAIIAFSADQLVLAYSVNQTSITVKQLTIPPSILEP